MNERGDGRHAMKRMPSLPLLSTSISFLDLYSPVSTLAAYHKPDVVH
jgi:hypothetical protein